MKYEQIIPQTIKENVFSDMVIDVEQWHSEAKSLNEILRLAQKEYGELATPERVQQALMVADQPRGQELNEVKMTTNVFDEFISSEAASGIKAGFEAELIFRGIAETGNGSYDDDPEMDESDDTRPSSIDEICEFFHDGDHNSDRDIAKLRKTLNEEYQEWYIENAYEGWHEVEEEQVREYIENNDWDFEDEMEGWMDNEMDLTPEAIERAMEWNGNRISSSREERELLRTDQSYTNFAEARDAVEELLNDRVRESINDQDRNYENARDEWLGDQDDYSESDWLRTKGRPYMTDIYREYDINWPYWTYLDPEPEGGYSESEAQRLADHMEDELDVEIKVASGYHSATRKPNLWIFEPDSSLEPDDTEDMPVEIISPPMNLPNCLEILPRFFAWAQSQDAYSNDSTGFHIGVSLPIHGGNVDYVKLALFLGDQYVLDQFDRGTNYFAKSALSKLRSDLESGKIKDSDIAGTLKLMKGNVIELANKTLRTGKGEGFGHGKYTSINMKGDYIEFRSMGSEKYFTDPESLKRVLDTVKRYAYAMYIAASPELFRDEYAKKLYKMLDSDGNGAAEMKIFADYVAAIGGADQQTVKNFIATLKSTQYKDAPLPDRSTPVRTGRRDGQPNMYWWKVEAGRLKLEVQAQNKEQAKIMAAQKWNVPPMAAGNWSITHITDPIILGRLNNRPTIDLDL